MKKLFLSLTVIASVSLFSCGTPADKKQDDGAVPHDTSKGISAQDTSMKTNGASLAYVCPCGGCPEVKESKPGKCPKCDLDLVEQKK